MEISRNEWETHQYHLDALSTALEEFIKRAPAFKGDEELASVLGTQLANLASWIKENRRG